MAINLKTDMRKLGKYERRLGTQFASVLSSAVTKAAAEIQAEARRLALRKKIYDLGRFHAGLRAVPKGANSVTLYNTTKHAPFVEGGRRAGARMPPREAILPWVLRKGLPASAAWPIARAIARRGIKPRRVITQPTFQRRARSILAKHVNAAMQKAHRRAR